MKCLRFLFLAAFSVLAAVSACADEPTFAGAWDTTYGHMDLKVEGKAVRGIYQTPGEAANEIRGKLEGRKLNFTYTETSAAGEGTFTLAADGLSFSGEWSEKGSIQSQPWGGRRAAATARDFSGVWQTSFGQMRLIQKENTVTGCYSFGGQSELGGTVKNGVLQYTYTESTGARGGGEFKLAADGSAFTGTWKTADAKQGGAWEGTRVMPVPGRTWLVVLEAHWESSLQQNEYSYGDMLRQFFTRVPSVSVRHRFFDGKEDFAKWCEDLPYLNEPVVFYISSHGTEQGITVGPQVLSGEFIGRQLRFASEIKLVHLGACLAMAGPVPVSLRKASGLSAPVSGFTNVADWAGSAVIDFSYLDLVLTRKVQPADAVRQILKSVSFAGETDDADCAIKPAGLKIVP